MRAIYDMRRMKRWLASAVLLVALGCSSISWLVPSSAWAQEEGPPPDAGPADESDPAHVVETTHEQPGEVIEIVDRATPGSVQTIGPKDLERFEHDDVHQVLSAVPGVYIREEDGFGLRPNIGMRGSGAERSAKIALMEDGVLIAPAPYSAPAAYYFPLVTRMQRVDVLKGPAAIQYGPNTVGGAVNMISRSVPRQRRGELDLAMGQHLYGKLHASYADSSEHVAFLVEGVKLHSGGFKELDNGGPTGFDKNDLQLKLRVNNDTVSRVYHQLDIKLGYADEVSDETYTGLTAADFQATPYRRYAATQLDRMQWRHLRAQLDYHIDVSTDTRLLFTAYRNDFSRDWRKLDGFNGSSLLADILANPDAGNNAVFYSILQGLSDSTSDAEMLILGTNSRDFSAQGVQAQATLIRRGLFGVHEIDIGLRLHHDEAIRRRFEDRYWMMSGALVETGGDTVTATDSTGSTLALASYLRDEYRIGRLSITAGVRSEFISNRYDDQMTPSSNGSRRDLVLIPGAGAVFQILPSLGILAGVHKGFVPVSPGQAPEVTAEESVNYEAGLRYADFISAFELIGFFSDYSNIKGTCTFSSGCLNEQVGDEFNGGSVHVFGLEALAGWQPELMHGLRAPLSATYTYNHSRFQESFSSDNPQWGDVTKGDELPYLPAHQLSVRAGVAGPRWELSAALRYVSAMRDVAGQGAIAEVERVAGHTVIDMAAHYEFGRFGKLYLTVDNILDQAHMVSLRPVGARPGKPRLLILGYKNHF